MLPRHVIYAVAHELAHSALELISGARVSMAQLEGVIPELAQFDARIKERVYIEGLYADLVKRQAASIEAYRREANLKLPHTLDYDKVIGLSREARDQLSAFRPETLGAASRLQGCPCRVGAA
eukprot:m.101996 g.101996  ORF g.101996 m.101996 type:complete len:123 (+) comp8987_c0_seq1:1717-2085(+)